MICHLYMGHTVCLKNKSLHFTLKDYRIGPRSDSGGRRGAKSGEVFLCQRLQALGSGWKAEVGDQRRRRQRGSFFQVGGRRSDGGGRRRTKRNVKTSF